MISRRQIISRSVGPIFAIFSPNESILGADDRSGPLFWYLKGRCHCNQFCVVPDCSLGAKVSQDSLYWFSQSLHNTVGIELQMITTFYVGYRGTRVRVYICLSVCLSVCPSVGHDHEPCNKWLCYGRGTTRQLVSRNSVTTKHPI